MWYDKITAQQKIIRRHPSPSPSPWPPGIHHAPLSLSLAHKLPLLPLSFPGTFFFSSFKALVNRLNSPPFFFISRLLVPPDPLFIELLSTDPSASASLFVHEMTNAPISSTVSSSSIPCAPAPTSSCRPTPMRRTARSSSSAMGSHESKLDAWALDAALRRLDRDDRLELDRWRMNAGRGGESESSASRPSSFSCSSFCDVSAREDRRSCDAKGDFDWRRMVEPREDVMELREVDDGELRRSDERLDFPRRDERDEDELDRGAETGMTIPLFLMPERENLGAMALAEKSTSGGVVVFGSPFAGERFEGVAGMASAQRPDAVLFGGGRLTGEVGGEVGGVGGRNALGAANAVPSIIDLGLNARPRSLAAEPTLLHCAGGGLMVSSGEDGGLRSPPMLMKLLLLRTGGRDAGAASSTSCRRGLDTLTRLWRYDELLRLIRAGRGPKSVRSVPAAVGGRDGESRRAW